MSKEKTPREVVAAAASAVCGKPRVITHEERNQINERCRTQGIGRRSVGEYLATLGYAMPDPARQQPTLLKLIEAAFTKAAAIKDPEELRKHKGAVVQAIAKEAENLGIPAPSWNVVREIARNFAWPAWPNLGVQRSEEDEKLKRTLDSMRKFAKVYNDFKTCPLMHDLLRVLYPDSVQKDQRALLKRKIAAYRAFRAAHPEHNLPELILRKGKDGSMIGIPEGVREQLAEFQIDVQTVQKAKGLIITSAQFGATLNIDAFDAFKRYAKHLGYVLVVMPIKYGAIKTVHQKEQDKRVLMSTFDERLKGYMLFEDQSVAGDMLTLNTLRLRPTLTTFLTDPVCERGGDASQIFAAPKLELEYRPRLRHDYPKAIMTTGAVTHPNYNVDNLGQQDRTGEIARAEHTYSAIIVEFTGKKTFHFRQLLANTKGEFYDIDPLRGGAVFVTPKSVTHAPDAVEAVVLGDWHVGKTHPDVRKITFEDMLPTLKPKHIVLHDLFDGDSISHWEEKQGSRRAYKGSHFANALEPELKAVGNELAWMGRCVQGAKLHVVASNHNEFLRKWLEEGRWKHDDVNIVIAAELFLALQKDLQRRDPEAHELAPMDPVNWWLDQQKLPNVVTHSRRSTLILPQGEKAKKIMLSLHGDIGPRGQKAGALNAFRKWNHWLIVGHDHSGAIRGPIWRVGTSSHLTDHYVSGPSTNWTHTHAVVYANGQRQLINIMNGTYHGRRKHRSKSAGLQPEGARKPLKKKARTTRKRAA
ncbi:MAG: hypothetical protein QY323_06130 [Patescibacteria group bacterium]|nr:MAG: hypothetical protein QY323_06130 [Patescibacteria group bacterium]